MLPIETEAGLILPGHPDFDAYLYCTLPPNWRIYAYHNPDFAFIVRSGSGGLLAAVTETEMQEYVEGGEYNERLLEMDDEDLIYEYQD